jgi:hypothetical protein
MYSNALKGVPMKYVPQTLMLVAVLLSGCDAAVKSTADIAGSSPVAVPAGYGTEAPPRAVAYKPAPLDTVAAIATAREPASIDASDLDSVLGAATAEPVTAHEHGQRTRIRLEAKDLDSIL